MAGRRSTYAMCGRLSHRSPLSGPRVGRRASREPYDHLAGEADERIAADDRVASGRRPQWSATPGLPGIQVSENHKGTVPHHTAPPPLLPHRS